MMLAPVTHILPITTLRRERVLPSAGKVLVRKGQKVSATDTLAEANLYPEHLLLDIAHGLGLRPDRADEQIQVKPGAEVAEGDILAGPVGLTRRVVRAPRSGRVVVAGSGQILIEVNSIPFELKAGLPGEIAELIPDRGVVIEASGALIQGVWGNGQVGFGMMNVLAKTPEQTVTHDQIDVTLRGSVVLAGHCASAEVFRAVEDQPLRGLILGSIDPHLLAEASRIQVPVLVVEGFGQVPMNSAAYKLLTTNEQREAVVNAEPWDRYTGSRPEVFIPLPAMSGTPAPKSADVFSPGQQVHIVRKPYQGNIGVIQDLPGMMTFPSGLRSQAAEIRLDSGEVVCLPLANLEVIA